MEAVGGEFLRRYVVANVALRRRFRHQVADQVRQLLFCARNVRAPVQECCQCGVVASPTVRDERVRLEDGVKPLPRIARAVPELVEVLQVR